MANTKITGKEVTVRVTEEAGIFALMEWCNNNCQGRWRNKRLFQQMGLIYSTFVFEVNEDATLFALTW